MTEFELSAIRNAIKDAPTMLFVFPDASGGSKTISMDDVRNLVAAIDERDRIIHDMMLDGKERDRLIRESERGAVLAEVKHLIRKKRRQKKTITSFDVETQIIGTRGVVRDPLPPDQVRQKIDHMMDELRDVLMQTNHDGETVLKLSSESSTPNSYALVAYNTFRVLVSRLAELLREPQ